MKKLTTLAAFFLFIVVAANAQIETLKVPDGFVVERVTGPPLVERPMLAGFDDRGRLYVADSAGLNLPGADLLKKPPHKIRRLEAANRDGIFDKSTVFADKMVFPQGVVWYNGSVYVSSPPNFWRLQDTDGDGVADKREILASGFALTGISDDMHGGSLGPDGRIYWFAGRLPHEIKDRDGKLLHRGRWPLLLRCRPDGSDLEMVSGAHGNCVGAAFTPEGEPFACGTFYGRMGIGLRDAIIHCVDGAEYPVLDLGISNEHKHTGELMPALTHFGVAAAAGLTIYRGDQFGANFQGNLFSALFNMHKIVRHVLERDGATFKSRDEDFLTSTNPDFHPTDVIEDADGSLLVVDTGGWFRIGCPTSNIAKPDITGGIYRIRRKGAPPVADARGLDIKWDSLSARELAPLLGDPRFAVREHAIQQLANLGDAAIEILEETLRQGALLESRRNAIWALTRMDGKAARVAARIGLNDKEASVRQTSERSVGLYRDADAVPRLMELVRTEAPPVRREAATALGRIRRADAVPALLEGLRGVGDRFLQHALVFALIEINDRAATLKGLGDSDSAVRRGALIALDQMDDGHLKPEMVMPFLDPADAPMRQTALWVIANHPDWAKPMLGVFEEWLKNFDDTKGDALKRQLLAFSKASAIQEFIAQRLHDEKTPPAVRLVLLETIAQSPLNQLPASWGAELQSSLTHGDARVVRQAVATIRGVPLGKKPLPKFDEPLLKIASDVSNSIDLRVEALAAAAPRLAKIDPALFELLTACIHRDQSPLVRMTAAGALSQLRLDDSQLLSLTRVLPAAGALEMSRLLAAFAGGRNMEVGARLLSALEKSPALGSIRAGALRETLINYPPEIQQSAGPLLEKLSVNVDKQKARLAELQPALKGGSALRGRELFFNKAACFACHTVRGAGGNIGPDLSKIGAIRAGPDLLESIVFPSASFARGFEPFTIVTRDGELHYGIISRETADAIYFYDGARVETRLPRSTIKEIRPGTVSIMPEGLEAPLSLQELGDVIAFLLSLR